MALPFKRDPEPAGSQAETDPFLEFEPERPSLLKTPLSIPLPDSAPPVLSTPQSVAPPAVSLQIRHRSGVGAVVALILLVALVGAGVALAALGREQIGHAFSSLTQRVRTAATRQPSGQGGVPVSVASGATTTVPPVAGGALPPAAVAAAPAPVLASTPPAAVVPAPPIAPAPGIVAFRSPLDLEVYHQGQLIGTTGGSGLTLPAGVADLVLVSSRHEFRQARSITVTSGQSAAVVVTLPNGRLSVNAEPWAEVLIDNRPVGITPLANLSVRIGSHEVVWRHPTLGERRQVVVVKARTPTRIGVNFRR